ncbi:hypothetical protein Tco_1482834 [Tanacetum coccineum]
MVTQFSFDLANICCRESVAGAGLVRDVPVFQNSKTKEEDVKEDESDHNKERYTFEDDDDDGEFDDLD